jgi:nucleoside-diphosphate-sugar epimerase
VVLAVTNPSSAGRIYNVGEFQTPTMAERLADFARAARWPGRILEVPASALVETDRVPYDFVHHIIYDTSRIRSELGYKEVIPHDAALVRALEDMTRA